MPIYEYQCPQCGHVFEEWVKASESLGEEPCPRCGAVAPRVMSQTSFVLKGGGWYVSDYGYRKGIKEETGSPAPAGDEKAGAADSGKTTPKAEAAGTTAKAAEKPTAKPKAESAAKT
ncbi:MAG: zinc ribbon domain-containing protein [Desulfovibrionaceae bacterium]|nr:zinc ribbon domain-containing protein [Desulfovibrionaceae bacterium]